MSRRPHVEAWCNDDMSVWGIQCFDCGYDSSVLGAAAAAFTAQDNHQCAKALPSAQSLPSPDEAGG